jgi:DNA-binding NtrC family response regulator
MKPQQVLILDLDPVPCTSGDCRRLCSVIREKFPDGELILKGATELPCEGTSQADLLMIRLPEHASAVACFEEVRRRWETTPIMALVCGHLRAGNGLVNSLLQVLDDFCTCPFSDFDLIPRVERLLGRSRGETRVRAVKPKGLNLDRLVGESENFIQAVAKIPRLTCSAATVLIAGETGTGKELFARAIHYNGSRRHKPFIPINCGALPDHLFENEFFGHARGAFTDAHSAEKGLVSEAEGGTIFLDEIDTLGTPAQAKLLRFLQDWEYRPLGTPRAQVANVRLISATNADLRSRIKAGLFREDLFHRLNILSLVVPALRDRISDIPLLANHFLTRYAEQYNLGDLKLTGGALHRLMRYPWPGNVREMEAMLHRAALLCNSSVIGPDDLELPESSPPYIPLTGCLRREKSRVVEQFEKEYLTTLLSELHGNISRAARVAGTERRAFQRLIRKHGLEREAFLKIA